MSANQLPPLVRVADLFTHIDMGFLNRRLALTAIGQLREEFDRQRRPGEDHFTSLSNDHLLVQLLIDLYTKLDAPTLLAALHANAPKLVFMSTERVEACPAVYTDGRVQQQVYFDVDPSKPVVLTYHTRHIVSDTGRMTLSDGHTKNYREAIVGILHDKTDHFEIEPIVMGSPWLDHPRNKEFSNLAWMAHDHGEILPEDIEEFANLKQAVVHDANEWMRAMKAIPEDHVKNAIASLLKEPPKSDWGGEETTTIRAT